MRKKVNFTFKKVKFEFKIHAPFKLKGFFLLLFLFHFVFFTFSCFTSGKFTGRKKSKFYLKKSKIEIKKKHVLQ